MPDGDVIRRGVRYPWRAAYQGLCSGGADADIKGIISRGLAASLRTGGIPSLSEAAALVQNAWTSGLPVVEAMGQIAVVSGSVGGTRTAALLDASVRQVLAVGPTGARADQAIAEAFCRTVIQAELMSKLRPAMLEDENRTPAEVEAMIDNWTSIVEEPVRRIAQEIVADPAGEKLRSPRSVHRRRRATSELLDELV